MVESRTKSLFCCLHSNLHAVILQQALSLQLLREKEDVTQELELLQSSAACSTSSLDVVSNKVRLLEKEKTKPAHDGFLSSFTPCGNMSSMGWEWWADILVVGIHGGLGGAGNLGWVQDGEGGG